MARAHRRAEHPRIGPRAESRAGRRPFLASPARPVRRRALVDAGSAAVCGSRARYRDRLPDRRGSRGGCPSTAMCFKIRLERGKRSARFRPSTSRNAISSPLLRARCSPPLPVGAPSPGGRQLDPHPRRSPPCGACQKASRSTTAQIVRDLGGTRHALCHVLSGRERPHGGPQELVIFRARQVASKPIGVSNSMGIRAIAEFHDLQRRRA